MCTVLQNFMPIGATVAKISNYTEWTYTEQTLYPAILMSGGFVPCDTDVWRVNPWRSHKSSLTVISRDHTFSWATEFRVKPQNLPFAVEFPYFR